MIAVPLGIILFFCVFSPVDAYANDSGIRPFPYPFVNSVSFASDVDSQTVDEGIEFHRQVNTRLGLPVSDSLWVKTDVNKLSGLFGKDNRLNEYITRDGMPAYFYLLREWYRGHIDHFHSWQSDAIPIHRYKFPTSTILSEINSRADINWPGKYFADSDNLTIITKGRLPESSRVKFTLNSNLSSGKKTEPKIFNVSDAIVQQNEGIEDTFSYSWSNRLSIKENIALAEIKVRNPISIHIENLNCIDLCEFELIELVFSDFSRRDVFETAGWLQDAGIHPNYITSHGGRTHLQNYSDGKRETERNFPPPFDDPNIDAKNIVRGNKRGYYSYHTDLLRRLGTRALWIWDKKPLIASSAIANKIDEVHAVNGTSFYSVDRTTVFGVDIDSKKSFVETFRNSLIDKNEPSKLTIADFYCGPTCNFSQGDMVDLLIAQTLDQNKSKEGHELFWYTHFGSGGNKAIDRSADIRFEQSVFDWFAKLSSKYYSNSRGYIGTNNAIWVQSASTYINYLLNRPYVMENSSIDKVDGRVNISSWNDRVNGLKLPNPYNPSPSLHGFTFEVDDPSDAVIFIDGVALKYILPSYDRNESLNFVTVVDTSTPTSFIPGANLDEFLNVNVIEGEYRDCFLQKLCDGLEFVTDDKGNVYAEVTFKTSQSLFNSPYLLVDFTERTDFNNLEYFEVVIEMKGGNRLKLSSRADDSFDGAKLDVEMKFLKAKGYYIAPLYLASWLGDADCNFDTRLGCDIPYGAINKFSFRAKLKGDNFNVGINKLSFLRPNPASASFQKPDQVLIAGRVLPFDHSESNDYWVVMSDSVSKEERRVKVNKFGVFSISNVERNIAVKLTLVRKTRVLDGATETFENNNTSIINRVKNFFSKYLGSEIPLNVPGYIEVSESACDELDQGSTWVWVERFTADIEISLNSVDSCFQM